MMAGRSLWLELRRRSMIGLLAASALGAAACAGGMPRYDYAKEYDPRKHEYVIGPADGLAINVWRNGDLSFEATVRPDGTITMPLIGDLQVAGKTPSQVRDEITKRMQAFVKDESAVVTVAVTEIQSYRFTVAGSVEQAGIFQSDYYVTVADAIAMAGGPTRFADADEVKLIRTGPDGKIREIPINYELIKERKAPQMNLVLVSGDTVFVP
jgi:polysaccharide export outer membrane protein